MGRVAGPNHPPLDSIETASVSTRVAGPDVACWQFAAQHSRRLCGSARMSVCWPSPPLPIGCAARHRACAHDRPVRRNWARLLKRVFEINMAHCREVRWRTEDHCGDPGIVSDREDPHALGVAGAGTPSRGSPWPGASSGLTLPNCDSSSDPATQAAGVGCI